MTPYAGGDNAVFQNAVAAVQVIQNALAVYSHLHSLTHLYIRQIRILFIQSKVGYAHPLAGYDAVFVRGLIGAGHHGSVQIVQVNHIQFAVLEHQILGVGVGHDTHDNLFHRGLFAPVVFVAHQGIVVVGHPLRNDVGARANGVFCRHTKIGNRLAGFLVNNGHGGGGQLRQEAGVGRGQSNIQTVIAA